MNKLIFFVISIISLSAQNSLQIADTRYNNEMPNSYSKIFKLDFKMREAIGVPGTSTYSTNLTIAPWVSDGTGGYNHQLNFNNGGLFWRTGGSNSTSWNPWNAIAYNGISSNFYFNSKVGIGISNPDESLVVSGKFKMSGQPSPRWNNSISSYVFESAHYYAHSASDRIYYGESGNINTFRGKVGIGTISPQYELSVNGTIAATKVKITSNIEGADFVFEDGYNLKSLEQTEKFIKENKHLPEIPSAKDMKVNGLDMSGFQIKLLQKIEELTLHTIEQGKLIKKQNNRILELEKKINQK